MSVPYYTYESALCVAQTAVCTFSLESESGRLDLENNLHTVLLCKVRREGRCLVKWK